MSIKGGELVAVKTELDLTVPNPVTPVSEEEYPEIWKFMINEIHDKDGICRKHYLRPSDKELWIRYKLNTGSPTSVDSLLETFMENVSEKVRAADLDETTKTKLLFSYDIPVGSQFLEELRKRAEIESNENGCILKYRENEDGGLSLSITESKRVLEMGLLGLEYNNTAAFGRENGEMKLGNFDEMDSQLISPDSSIRRNKYTTDDETSMWKFLLKKIKETGKIVARKSVKAKGIAIWREYKLTHETDRAEESLSSRFRKIMSSRLHLANLDVDSKVNLYYALGIPVDKEFLKHLKTMAVVEVDQEGCIIRYMKIYQPATPTNERFGSDGVNVKQERKRSLVADNESPTHSVNKKVKRSRSEGREPDMTFEQLLSTSAGSSNINSHFTPLKRVQIEENANVSDAVVTLLANRIVTEREECGTVAEETPSINLVTDQEEQPPCPSITPPEVHPEALSEQTTQSGSLSEPLIRDIVESLGKVIVKQNTELMNEFKRIVPIKETREGAQPIDAPPEEDNRRTKDFLNLLNRMILSLNSPSLNECLDKVRLLAEKVQNENTIPMERIRVILEATLAMIPL